VSVEVKVPKTVYETQKRIIKVPKTVIDIREEEYEVRPQRSSSTQPTACVHHQWLTAPPLVCAGAP